ncbi:MAG: tetratricopeptide repeat protein [Alcanivoracaceae bacterium]|nr:tetratricopeptide repeat protein [Alcanivoracaceae bacterium]
MTDYTEEEQVELIRKWWAENGVSVVVAIVIAVGGLIGWRQWQAHTADQSAAASTIYQKMLEGLESARSRPDSETDYETVRASAQQLVSDYESSAYADYAHLTLARLAVEGEDYATASAELQAVIDAPASETLEWLATIRLARINVQTGELDAAEKLVSGKVPESFTGQALEIKGDILRARDNVSGARAAYSEALEKTEGEAHKELVRMKMQDLAPVL